MHSVLFVCTANRCRSPMAEAIFRGKLKRISQLETWKVASAGTWTEDGLPAVEGARLAMAEKGLSLESHWSRLLTAKMMQTFNLVLVMEREHKEELQVEFPELRHKVYMLSEMAGYKADIDDPVGGSVDDYLEAAEEMAGIIEVGFDKIEQESRVIDS